MKCRQINPDLSSMLWNNTAVRARRVPKRVWIPSLNATKAASAPQTASSWIKGVGPCAGACWVETWTKAPRSCLSADRAYDIDAFRTGFAQQDIKAGMPARARRTTQTPDSTTRNGIERATPWNAASVGSGTGHAWPRATTNMPLVAWGFCTWRAPCFGRIQSLNEDNPCCLRVNNHNRRSTH